MSVAQNCELMYVSGNDPLSKADAAALCSAQDSSYGKFESMYLYSIL